MIKEMELFTQGTVITVNGREFTRLVGGFGEDKPMFTIWQAGELLNLRTAKVFEDFERNASNFELNIDFIDLKVAVLQKDSENNVDISKFLKDVGYSQNKLNATKKWLAFSFSGMMKLVKIAETEESWNIYDNFLEDYFKTKAENKEYKKTLEEELEFIKKEKATTIGMIAMEENESKRIELSIQLERYSNRISKIESALDNKELRIALENQAKLAESKSKYVNQSEFGSRFNNKIGAKTIGKLLKIVGLGKKSNNDNGRTIPYQNFVPDYAVNIINNNKELDYDVAYKWNYNRCSRHINQWLLDNDYHDKFYSITDKEELIKFVDNLYNTYINKAS